MMKTTLSLATLMLCLLLVAPTIAAVAVPVGQSAPLAAAAPAPAAVAAATPAVSSTATQPQSSLSFVWNFFLNSIGLQQQTAPSNVTANVFFCTLYIRQSPTQLQVASTQLPNLMCQADCKQQCAQYNSSGQQCIAYVITPAGVGGVVGVPPSNNMLNIVTSTTTDTSNGQPCACPQVAPADQVANDQMATTTTTAATTAVPTTTPTTTKTTTTTTTTTTPATTTTTTPTTTLGPLPASATQVAFSASSTSSTSQTGTIVLTDVTSNYNNHYSSSTGQWVNSAPAIYFVEMCTGVTSGQPVNMHLTGSAPLTVGLTWDAKIENGVDTVCRAALDEPAYQSTSSLFLDNGSAYSDSNALVTFTSFSLTSILTPSALSRVVYAVSQSTPPMVNNTLTPIPLVTQIAPASPDTFNAHSGLYTCGSTAPHVVVASVGVQANTPTVVKITGPTISYGLSRTGKQYDGTTTMSRVAIVPCSVGQTIQFNLESGTVIDSDGTNLNNLTTFAVFPYEPQNVTGYTFALNKWYIAFNNNAAQSTAPIDPFYFTNITLNNGGMYDDNSRNINIKVSGYYYLHLTCGAGEGVYGSTFLISVNQGATQLLAIKHTSTNGQGTDFFSKSAIVHLNAGDVIRAVGQSNSYFYSSIENYEISLHGFLLYTA